MIVKIDRRALTNFRRRANHNPNEIFGYLVGYRRSPQLVEIFRIDYPKLAVSTPNLVQTDGDSDNIIVECAKDDKLHVVGSIHSHPNALPIMSRTDLCTHRSDKYTVSGIVSIDRGRTKVAFWDSRSPIAADWEYI